MKKFIIIIGVAVLISAAIIGVINIKKEEEPKNTNYLRIHIRANSNSDEDQGVKYAVKESVVCFLNPYIERVDSVEEAICIIKNKLCEIERIADDVLKLNGFNYKSRAKICVEEFPTRSYDDLTLDAGIYDALIIELGSGEGNNWWCVVYPPLCFVSKGGTDGKIVYKSLIYEIICGE